MLANSSSEWWRVIRPKPLPRSDKAIPASSVNFARHLILDAGGDRHAITIFDLRSSNARLRQRKDCSPPQVSPQCGARSRHALLARRGGRP
jgi:hypothetical protein